MRLFTNRILLASSVLISKWFENAYDVLGSVGG